MLPADHPCCRIDNSPRTRTRAMNAAPEDIMPPILQFTCQAGSIVPGEQLKIS
jgi:hypothetical protein